MLRIAYFVTPHGFGHAARACAVMEAIKERIPDVQFDIFTSVPQWFFSDSLGTNYTYHLEKVDVGLVQKNPFLEDLDATLEALRCFIPFSPQIIERLSKLLVQLTCRLVICDISPLGLQAARHACIPSVLIENFTWDWIYKEYLKEKPDFYQFISLMEAEFDQCTYHIQTDPLCNRISSSDLLAPPISRAPKSTSSQVRSRLKIPETHSVLLFTMGGIETNVVAAKHVIDSDNRTIIIPGGSNTVKRIGNLILLPHHSEYYHPDLIHASNAVISKLGYSTIAETYYAAIPLGYIPRDHFRESQPLADFVNRNMSSISIQSEELTSPQINEKIRHLLGLIPSRPSSLNGSDFVAEFILKILHSQV